MHSFLTMGKFRWDSKITGISEMEEFDGDGNHPGTAGFGTFLKKRWVNTGVSTTADTS